MSLLAERLLLQNDETILPDGNVEVENLVRQEGPGRACFGQDVQKGLLRCKQKV